MSCLYLAIQNSEHVPVPCPPSLATNASLPSIFPDPMLSQKRSSSFRAQSEAQNANALPSHSKLTCILESVSF